MEGDGYKVRWSLKWLTESMEDYNIKLFIMDIKAFWFVQKFYKVFQIILSQTSILHKSNTWEWSYKLIGLRFSGCMQQSRLTGYIYSQNLRDFCQELSVLLPVVLRGGKEAKLGYQEAHQSTCSLHLYAVPILFSILEKVQSALLLLQRSFQYLGGPYFNDNYNNG